MIKVTKLATSGPAAAKGVKPGDILIEIATKDGRVVTEIADKDGWVLAYPTLANMNMDVKQVTKLTKGSPGSSIKLKLKRVERHGSMEYEVMLECSGGTGTSEMASIRGMQGRVPGTVRCFDKVHDWVQVACVSVSVSESVIESGYRSTLFFINSYTQLYIPAHQSTHVDRRVGARAVVADLHGYINGFARTLDP